MFWYQKPLVWIAVGIVACAGLLAMPRVLDIYRSWSGARKVQRATEALANKDYETAMINARGALATNAKDLEALRVMARTAEAVGSPHALDFRRQIEAIAPQDTENLMGLAQVALQAGNLGAAEQAFKNLPPESEKIARYHDVAAGIALAKQDFANFELHTEAASKLAPDNDSYRLALATLRLSAKLPAQRAEALATLEKLKEKPETTSSALRSLLRDAMNRKERERAIEIADMLASAPGASMGDKLSRLSALQALLESQENSPIVAAKIKKEDFYQRLAELQKEAETKADLAVSVATWMNEHHLALQVPEWLRTLPAEIVSNPRVCSVQAESLTRASNWADLKSSIENVSWEKLDFRRLAYLARAFEGLKDPGASASAWGRALAAAQVEPGALRVLASDANKWGWTNRAEEALWKLAAEGRAPRWLGDALWGSALRKGDTQSMYKASKLLLESEPKSVSARNSFIHLALITQQDEAAAYPLAESLYKENSEDPAIAPTYALSLFRQNRPQEAISVLSKLPPAQFQEPWLALYRGLFLVAAGQPDEAEEYLQAAATAPLLPEMESIRRILTRVFDAKRFERDGNLEEARASWTGAVAAADARPDWLELLAKVAVKWGWEDKASEVLSKLAGKGRCPAWAIPTLWAASLKTGDSGEIYNAAKLVLNANPKVFEARNNFITAALLSGKTADSPYQLAEALSAEYPGNVDAAATFSLSLYRQGKSEQALTVLRELSAEQRRQPRPSLYEGFILAGQGQPDEAESALEVGAGASLLPEEKQILDTLQAVFRWHALQKGGGEAAAVDDAWKKAASIAERRPEMLETLGRMLLKWEAPEKATEVLWKIAATRESPRWVVDHLWADAERRRDSTKLYQLSKLLRRTAPEDVALRNNFVRLSLLTGQDADFPHRLADALLDENPGNAEIAATGALSLLERKKPKEALALFAAIKPEQLRKPRVAYYYGVALTANGESVKAAEFLQIGREQPLLPEEESLLGKVQSEQASANR